MANLCETQTGVRAGQPSASPPTTTSQLSPSPERSVFASISHFPDVMSFFLAIFRRNGKFIMLTMERVPYSAAPVAYCSAPDYYYPSLVY